MGCCAELTFALHNEHQITDQQNTDSRPMGRVLLVALCNRCNSQPNVTIADYTHAPVDLLSRRFLELTPYKAQSCVTVMFRIQVVN
jgi:hypothetical protein